MRLLLLAVVLAGCNGTPSTVDTDPDTETDLPQASDLGQFCPMGCNLETCVDDTSEDCETSLCLYDGRTGLETYCTQLCDVSCPDGYTCLAPADGGGDVCMADPAVCGDSVVQRGEACDDGNTDDGDYCSADCSEVTTPPSGGTFTFGPPDGAKSTFEGDDPQVFAYRITRQDGGVDLAFGTSQNDLIELRASNIEAGDVPGTFSTTALTLFSVCNFRGTGQFTQLDVYDTDAKTAKGSYTMDIECVANCFDCGGMGDKRTYEGAFDVHYVDREE